MKNKTAIRILQWNRGGDLGVGEKYINHESALPQAINSGGIFFWLFFTAWLIFPIPAARVSKIAEKIT
jgi:hypothetical protein